jgi:GT2 family glycosyltransferase
MPVVSITENLVSIIVPCLGQLEYTKLCVPSVLKWSREPFELIFLDVGSLDGTAEYLAGVQAAAKPRVEIVRTETDLGIKEGCREAIGQARGEHIVLLNNDTLVTHGWLDQMIGLLKMSEPVGMVGPMSNYAAPPQWVESVPYRFSRKTPTTRSAATDVDVEAVQRFAAEFRETNKGKWMEVERLGGFCLMLKRDVWRKVEANIQEWTDLSLFDTDILSSKARQAGFMIACCRDLFIHHFGTRVFAHGAKDEKNQPPGR